MSEDPGAPSGPPEDPTMTIEEVKTALLYLEDIIEHSRTCGANFSKFYSVTNDAFSNICQILSDKLLYYKNKSGVLTKVPEDFSSVISVSLPSVLAPAPNLPAPRPALRYKNSDKGPFVVLLESSDTALGTMRDMRLGRLLLGLGVRGIVKIDRRGRNRVALFFRPVCLLTLSSRGN